MICKKMKNGDTVGLISPSHVADKEVYEKIRNNLEELGFCVKEGENLYKNTYGYISSEGERADDFNSMVADENVKMVFFGGGNGSIDILPLIDYEKIKGNPKYFLSYSDGTSILNAIYSNTGVVTYYGQTPANFNPPDDYTLSHFNNCFLKKENNEFLKKSQWHTLSRGYAEGILVGGYLLNFALLLGSPFFSYDENEKYILFLEDHEKFSGVGTVSAVLSHIEQTDFMKNVSGIVFGNYMYYGVNKQLFERLARLGEKNGIPVVYCDDFGHGKNHGILPIGARARLFADEQKLEFSDN